MEKSTSFKKIIIQSNLNYPDFFFGPNLVMIIY